MVRPESITAKAVHARGLNTARREIRDLRSRQPAREAIAGLDHETEIFGFTKGQFSLLDLIGAVFEITGPAHLSISTWTAASYEIQSLLAMLQRGDILGTRWLIDFSMARREPATTAQLRDAFGADNIRVAQNHAKWCIIQNPQWRVVLRSSMNLNMNPRFEDFQIAHDPELAAFLNSILDQVWAIQGRELADRNPYDIVKFFNDKM
ncbi:MAG: hypothetical protein LLG00_12325 [Planctomycetaceae bacterium]|nr:hypothetical protein [Planctomycetaceae bacterium]